MPTARLRLDGRKIRVGFASAFFSIPWSPVVEEFGGMLGRLSREKFDVAFIDLVHDAAPRSDPRSLLPSHYRRSPQTSSLDLITTGRRRAALGPRCGPPRPPGAGRRGDRHQESSDRHRMAQGGPAEDFGDRSRRARPPRPHAEPDVPPGRDVAARAGAGGSGHTMSSGIDRKVISYYISWAPPRAPRSDTIPRSSICCRTGRCTSITSGASRAAGGRLRRGTTPGIRLRLSPVQGRRPALPEARAQGV